MKSTGVARKPDMLGRIVIPVILRQVYGIDNGDPIEIYIDGDKIILKKYYPECIITGDVSDKNLTLANGTINLSPEGAQLLMKELEAILKKV